MNPYVVAINSISGGGKTALASRLHQSLPGSLLLCFDDFDSTNIHPSDYFKWYERGANIEEFDCPGFAEAVQEARERGETDFIILDYPFGREHSRLANSIDLSVFVDTPLDLALARRLTRDYAPDSHRPTEDALNELLDHVASYIERTRPIFVAHYHHKLTSDLVLDGGCGLDELRDAVLTQLEVRPSRDPSRQT